jgi:hypothetical protein
MRRKRLMLVAGYSMVDTGYLILVAGYLMLDKEPERHASSRIAHRESRIEKRASRNAHRETPVEYLGNPNELCYRKPNE